MVVLMRIAKYAKPCTVLFFCYVIFTSLAILSSLINFGLLTPLLRVLLDQEELKNIISGCNELPTFSLDLKYFLQVFHYWFAVTIKAYGKIGALYFLSCSLVVGSILNGVARYIADLAVAKIRINVVYNLRVTLFEKILTLPLQHFSDKKGGNILSHVSADVQEVEHIVHDAVRLCFKETIHLLYYLGALCYMSLELTCVVIVFLPLVGFVLAMITHKLKLITGAVQASLANMTHLAKEVLSGIYLVKAFGAEQYMLEKFQTENINYSDKNRSMAYRASFGAPIAELLSVVATATVLFYGGRMVLVGGNNLTISLFCTYVLICSQLLVPIKMIVRYITHIQRGLAAARRIFHMLDLAVKPATASISHRDVHYTFNDGIVFDNVSFAYSRNQEILHSISFEIKKGQKVAIVGSSGSGKSTILSLCMGLYQPNCGRIIIDNMPLQEMDRSILHQLFGVVTQDPVLFHDTVANNIRLHRTSLPVEDVIQASKVALVDDFVQNLPNGYETIIGDRGSRLSSGQKQRICIARAILNDPPILIFDEATSNMDASSEYDIYNNLRSFTRDKTFIVVTHKLSTITHVDKIIVIDEGRIVEEGAHQSLLAKGGAYHKLFTLHQRDGA